MPASRNARAMILAPRSWPSRPGLATRTRIGGAPCGMTFASIRAFPHPVRCLRTTVGAENPELLRDAAHLMSRSDEQKSRRTAMSLATRRIALISGANKGIGHETARQLGKLNVTVILGARDLARGEAAAAELKSEGIEARAVKLDVVDSADIAAVADYIEREFGVLDILI